MCEEKKERYKHRVNLSHTFRAKRRTDKKNDEELFFAYE